jgi:hypothetical protein
MKMYLDVSCSNTSIKLDEVSCGTPTGLKYLSCDDVSLGEPPDTGICDFDVGSTDAVTFELITSEGTSQDNTNSAVFSVTSETVMSSLYSDQNNSTSALDTPNENARLMEFPGSSMTEIPSALDENPNVASTKSSLTNTSMWIVFGVVLFLVVIIVAVSVFIIIRICRVHDIRGSVPATHYFNFRFFNNNTETYSKVNENYRRSGYISLSRFQKFMAPKQDLHYSCRDVTKTPGVSAEGQPETGTYRCSVILEINKATGCENEDLEDHVYEEVI